MCFCGFVVSGPPMADIKTKPTKVSPAAFIRRVATDQQQKDCRELIAMMRRITGAPPKMWGPSIVGFGTYHYVYDSGREGDMLLTGFSPRKPSLVLYVGGASEQAADVEARHVQDRGGCLYVKKLDDVDRDVLRNLLEKSVEQTRKRYVFSASSRLRRR